MSIEKVIARTLEVLQDKGFETSRPYINERSAINIVARSGSKLFLIKVLEDLLNLRSQCALEIKKASYALRAHPIVVSEKEADNEIDRGAAYEKQGIYAVHPDALLEYFEGGKQYVYYKGGRFYVKIDGKKLREIRERIGLSLGGLANLLGVTRKAVYEYEKGEMDATVDVAFRLYEVLKRYVDEEEVIQAFKPINILSDVTVEDFKKEESLGGAGRQRLQEEVALKLSRLGFSIFKFKDAPFNIIAKKNGEGGKTILILTVETLSDRSRKGVEVLKGVAEVAKVRRLVVARKTLRKEDGVINAKKLEDISSPEELIEVSSMS
ncbi:MAG: helix-turn-helix domain-containing protein [Candidatus Nezhaarchaeales archaeon]